MAETIVNFVLGKLADAVVKEVLLLHGVDEQVEAVSRELGRIQVFLKDADKKQITDEKQKHWVKEVRDIAYSIEDVIDTFLLDVPQKPHKSSKMETVKRMIKKTKQLPAVHTLVDEINQIQTKMKEIQASRETYGINNLGEGSGELILPIRTPVLHDIDPDIVGFKKEQDHLVKKLLDETTKRCSVVSICGTGGLGKTTLAQKVYNCNNVKGQFGLRIWVAVTKKFEIINVLRKIARQLEPPIKLSEQPEEAVVFLTEIEKSLRGKKYLIVLDDVWTNDLWIQIRVAFPNENNGSRVLITTRSSDVSKGMDPTCEPYKLKFLTDEFSRELLLKTTFPNLDPNRSSFTDLSDILGQFIDKCRGLPLALVVLGGLLSKKTRSNIAWSNIFRTMRWDVEGKECSEIIGTSYDDLPFVLKSCFMYFAAFPVDYVIHAPSLLQMWIAEGIIPQEDKRTLEETAESFLDDLVQRSMVQVDSRSSNGSIERIHIHDILRDLALQKAKEDNFLVVYSHPDDQTSLHRARRVAIHNSNCDQLMSQNLRTLLCFHNRRMPNCSKQRLLKVVSTGDNNDTKIELGMFEGLTQLRYLNLKGTLTGECEDGNLKKVICNMKFLETLNVHGLLRSTTTPGTKVSAELPDCAWHIKTLRHVIQYGLGPPSSAKLPNLQTLKSMYIRESWKTELPHLPTLHTLGLRHTSSSWDVVVTFLATLDHLISLSILDCDPIPSNILDMRGFPFYQHLQSLALDTSICLNSNEMVIDENMLPPHLTFLSIVNYNFQQDLMPVLEKLPDLKKLVLCTACKSRNMRCSTNGFSQLEVLVITGSDTLEEWEIENGAMPILKELHIEFCMGLGVPQGLQYLTNLQKLKWWQFMKNVDLVRSLCKHVPSLDLMVVPTIYF